MELLTVEQISERTGYSIPTVRRMIKYNWIDVAESKGRRNYYSSKAIDACLTARREPKARPERRKVLDVSDQINQLQTRITCLEQVRARDLDVFKRVLGQLNNRIKALENA